MLVTLASDLSRSKILVRLVGRRTRLNRLVWLQSGRVNCTLMLDIECPTPRVRDGGLLIDCFDFWRKNLNFSCIIHLPPKKGKEATRDQTIFEFNENLAFAPFFDATQPFGKNGFI